MISRLAAETAGFLTAAAAFVIAVLLAGRYFPDPAATTVLASLEPYLAWGLLALAAIFLLMRRFRRAAASALAATVFLVTFHVALAPYRLNTADAPASAIRLISFNILEGNTANAGRIAAFLEASDADIAVILEPRALQPELQELEASFPHRIGCGAGTPACSLVLMSRHPLEEATLTSLAPVSSYGGRLVTVKTTLDGRAVTIVAVHFTKPFYGPAQHIEFRRLAEHIREIKGPVILAGDFNSPAWTPGFKAFLETTGLRLAPRDPATWPVWLGRFGIPIDHVLVRGDAAYFDLQAIPDPMGSNHRGLEAVIAFSGARN